jgi:predicted acetyltransferase
MMEDYELKRPEKAYAVQIKEYRRTFLDMKKPLCGCAGLENYEHAQDWIDQCRNNEKGINLREGYVPDTLFLYVRKGDDAVCGMIDVRHYLNAYLSLAGGHIGYSVLPRERRKGIAASMLKAVLPYCRSIGLEKVMITCSKDNEGSRRTILHNHGIYEGDTEHDGEITEKYWIEL